MNDLMSIPDPAVREAMIQAFQSNLVAGAYSPGGAADNDVLYTSRLRLNLKADVADNVTFDGRLGMYKVWGDSTGVQVFNGQPTSIGVDGTTVGVPNSDILRVERAYFTWKDIAGSPTYLSIGRRLVNARLDGLASKPAFRHAWNRASDGPSRA